MHCSCSIGFVGRAHSNVKRGHIDRDDLQDLIRYFQLGEYVMRRVYSIKRRAQIPVLHNILRNVEEGG